MPDGMLPSGICTGCCGKTQHPCVERRPLAFGIYTALKKGKKMVRERRGG